jgi:CubicO group peptidase (beta-lactamase class C family)
MLRRTAPVGSRLLTRPTVEAMTPDQISGGGTAVGPSPDGSAGWGSGVGVQLRRTAPTASVGSDGWTGGLGSAWANDPRERLIGVVLTTDAFTSRFPMPTTIRDFWTGAYGAIGD